MLYPVRFISLFAIVLTFSPLLVANPDVVFSDSGDYDGAYLKHELKDSKIKFLLSKDVTGITLPDEYFSVKKLVDFVEFEYVFANDELRIEFLRMLRMSIESKFTLQQFMTEVLKFLDAFKQWL